MASRSVDSIPAGAVATTGHESPESADPARAAGHSGHPSALELIGATLALALAAALLLGGHVQNGGLYTDDWPIAAIEAQGGTWELVEQLFLGDHARPVTAVYLAVAQSLTGVDGGSHAAIGIGLHVLKCAALFWLLRRLTMAWWQAGAISLLVLLFPFADAVWLWFAVTQANLAIALALLGAIARLAGLERSGRRATALHVAATLLFALSVLTYEVAASLVLFTLLIYLPRAPRRTAIRLWLADVGAVVAAVAIPRIPGLLPGEIPHETLSLDEQLDHARAMVDQAASLVTAAAVPFGGPHRNIVIPVLFLILVVGVVSWRLAPRGSARRSELGKWVGWAFVGMLVVAASYAVFVPASAVWYQPTAYGSDNRINAVPAIGYCLFLFSTAMLLGLSLARHAVARAVVAVVAVAATGFLAVGYADRVRADVRLWDRAAALQRQQLARLGEIVGTPASGTTLYVYGGTGRVARGVFSFGVTWDLNGAVQLRWRDPTLHAYPIFAGTTIVCGADGLHPDGWINGNSSAQAAPYGKAVLVDLRDGRMAPVMGPRACAKTAPTFVPGPSGP